MDRPTREFVWRRASGVCEYCRMPQRHDPLPFQVDHIISLKHAGADDSDNLALACFPCNNHKGPNIAGFDRLTKTTIRLFNPRHDLWAQHFEWSSARLVGLTNIGRVTVDVLAINAQNRLDHREGLIEEGMFPPPS
jgi:HNH endonuclease